MNSFDNIFIKEEEELDLHIEIPEPLQDLVEPKVESPLKTLNIERKDLTLRIKGEIDEICSAPEKTVLYFKCGICSFRIELTRKNKDKIVDHYTSLGRFNQIIPPNGLFSFISEDLSFCLLVSQTNPQMGLVKLIYNYVCLKCKKKYPAKLKYFESLSRHIQECHNLSEVKKCIACSQEYDNLDNNHFNLKSDQFCKKIPTTLLQTQSFFCSNYAKFFMPFCNVCKEKCWPYVGQGKKMKPVCSDCKSKILMNDSIPIHSQGECKICLLNCSQKFITINPSNGSAFESILVGKKCLNKLLKASVDSSYQAKTKAIKKVDWVFTILLDEIHSHNLSSTSSLANDNVKGIHQIFEKLRKIM